MFGDNIEMMSGDVGNFARAVQVANLLILANKQTNFATQVIRPHGRAGSRRPIPGWHSRDD